MKYSTEEVRMQLIGYVKAHGGSLEDAANLLGCNVGNLESMMAGDAPIDDRTANRLGLRLVHHFEEVNG
jgi:hypothetical protein